MLWKQRLAAVCMASMLACALVSAFPPEGHAAAQLSPDSAYRVRGVVVNGKTGRPIGRALVCGNNRRLATLSNNEGRFELNFVPARSSVPADISLGQLQVMKPGYFEAVQLLQPADQGSSAQELRIALMPSAAIDGRVVTPESDPPQHVPVQLLSRQVVGGVRVWGRSDVTLTDSRGRFHFAGLLPGEYTLLTGQWFPGEVGPPSLTTPTKAYPATYNGDVSDLSLATTVRLHYGETAAPELHLQPATFYPVTVPVGNVRGTGGVEIYFTGLQSFADHALRFNPAHNAIEGTLTPGDYPVNLVSRASESALSASLVLHVENAPLRTGPVDLAPMAPIPVRVHRELTGTAAPPDSFGIDLFLEPESPGTPGTGTSQSQKGDFFLNGVIPGRYWVRVHCSTGYVAALSAGGIDLTQEPLSIAPGTSSPTLDVTVADGTADLTGSVQTGDQPLPRSVFVEVIPLDGELVSERRIQQADANGRFSITGITPGVYRVVAVPAGMHVEFARDREAIRALPSTVPTVTLTAGQSAQTDVPLLDGSQLGDDK